MSCVPPIPSPLSHAYILSGGSAASRTAYARRLAQAYVCTSARPPCGVCRACSKVENGIHPDVILVSPVENRRDILSEQTRALRSDAYIRPNEAERKVYIIDPADTMNPTAQNTLLKVLEEGPPYAAFLLLTAQSGALLETIRSRCEMLSLPPEEEPDQDERVRESAVSLMQLLSQGDELALLTFCVGLEKWDREDLRALFSRTITLLRLALSPAAAQADAAERQCAARLAGARSPQQILSAAETLETLRSACDFNVSAGHLSGWLCAALSGQKQPL